jgi:hypothetical protein
MDSIGLRLALAPALILAASLVSRQWGPAVGGWLVALPLTSGPVAFFLALDHGAGFAAMAALGSLAGAIAEIAFAVAYAVLARRGWPLAVAGASLTFTAVAALLQQLALTWGSLAAGSMAALVGALMLVPRQSHASQALPPPRWEIPARMAVTAALVLLITGMATVLGPRLSGTLAMFPVYVIVLTVFAHRSGPPHALHVLRGLLVGLFAGVSFFIVLAALVERAGVTRGFLAAVAVTLAVQGMSFAFVTRAASKSDRTGEPAAVG